MWRNIWRISSIFSVTLIVLAARPPRVSIEILNDFQGNIITKPFIGLRNNLYYFGKNKLSWYNANLACRSLGGFLASPNTQYEFATLSNFLISNYAINRWWLSGSDFHSEGNFIWYSNAAPFNYTNWAAGQPDNAGGNEHCVHLVAKMKKYKMNDWMCNKTAYYICEAEEPKTVAVSVF